MRLRLLFTTALVVLLSNGPVAAGQVCSEQVESGWPSAATEREASEAAKSWWSSRAGTIGRGYEDWNEAADKKVTCKVGQNGTYTCIASARPCLPDGVIPDGAPKTDL